MGFGSMISVAFGPHPQSPCRVKMLLSCFHFWPEDMLSVSDTGGGGGGVGGCGGCGKSGGLKFLDFVAFNL